MSRKVVDSLAPIMEVIGTEYALAGEPSLNNKPIIIEGVGKRTASMYSLHVLDEVLFPGEDPATAHRLLMAEKTDPSLLGIHHLFVPLPLIFATEFSATPKSATVYCELIPLSFSLIVWLAGCRLPRYPPSSFLEHLSFLNMRGLRIR